MRAAGKRHPGMVALHIDSHTDAYALPEADPLDPSTQFTHAATEGVIDVGRSWHVGIRGFTSVPGIVARARGMGFGVVTTEDLLRRGFAQTMAEFRDSVGQRPVYLCWDMDIFDPSVAPGVCTTWAGCPRAKGSSCCAHATVSTSWRSTSTRSARRRISVSRRRSCARTW